MRLLDLLIFSFSGVLGWVAKIAWDELKQMRKDLTEIDKGLRRDLAELDKVLPKEYVRKSDWDRATDRLIAEIREFRNDMGEQFDSIWKELKGKQDKGAD